MTKDVDGSAASDCYFAFMLGEWFRETVLQMQERALDQREMCRKVSVLDGWRGFGFEQFAPAMEAACDRHPKGGPEMLEDIRRSLASACVSKVTTAITRRRSAAGTINSALSPLGLIALLCGDLGSTSCSGFGIGRRSGQAC
jgi:hypothetical protein